MSHPLSKKQLEVLRSLESFSKSRHHIPSVRELASRLKKSPTTVFQHLKALERRGYLKSDGSAHGWTLLKSTDPKAANLATSSSGSSGAAVQPARQRESEPTSESASAPLQLVRPRDDDESRFVTVRIAGTIAAGQPIEAIEDAAAETHDFPADLVPSDAFALRVRGSSMIEDHICDGDLVLIRPQESVHDGEIAVALLEDGNATLKRLYREKGRIRLQPANASMEPIYADHVQVQGRVVGVWRKLR